MIIEMLLAIGTLAIMSLVLTATTACAMGELKGHARGYKEGRNAGYYQGYFDALTPTTDDRQVVTEECEAIR